MPRVCRVVQLGRVDYLAAWELQRQVHAAVAEEREPETLLLLEHPHVYTIGRRGTRADVLVEEAALRRLGVEVHEVDRGGEVTYHGPGQLVGYVIVNVRDMGPLRYVRALEQAIIRALADFGVQGRAIPGLTGVWVGEEKVAAIGVKVSRGVTSHGFALNVAPDLGYYQYIVPCGIADRGVTSLARHVPRGVSLEEAAYSVTYHLGRELGRKMVPQEAPGAWHAVLTGAWTGVATS